MLRYRKNLLFLLLLPLGFSSLYADHEAPFMLPSARYAGLGGSHAALSDDFTSLFINPAGFYAAKEEFSAAELSLSIYGPLFDIADIVTEYMGSSGNLDISGIVGPGGLATGADLGGPLSFGWVGRGLGFGFFNRTVMDAKTAGTSVRANASEELLLLGGYAFRIVQKETHLLDAGFLGKGYLRGSLDLEASILTANDLFDDDPLTEQPFTTLAGVGLDLGFLYRYSNIFSIGLVYKDLYSPAIETTYASSDDFFSGEEAVDSGSYTTIRPSLDFGFAYTPHSSFLEKYVSRLSFLLDYRDILDLFYLVPRNPVLNAGFGIELVVLDALSLRAGIGDALPALGFGIDFTFMQLDFAMRGVELGFDPGMNPTYAIDVGLLFRY